MYKKILWAAVPLILGAGCIPQITVKNTNTNTAVSSARISTTNPKAFGDLKQATPSAASETADANCTGGTNCTKVSAPAPDGTGIAIAPVSFSYQYVGDDVPLNNATVNVLQRTTPKSLTLPPGLRDSAGFGLVNLGTLALPNVESFSVRDGDEQWTINQTDGSISMMVASGTGAVKPMDSGAKNTNAPLNQSAARNIAAEFLEKHGISTAPYGSPIVTDNSVSILERSSLPTMFTPTGKAAQVLYPLTVSGLPVVQQSGDPLGMALTVDLGAARVMSLYGLNALNYSSSAYAAITDFTALKNLVAKGGMYGAAGPAAADAAVLKVQTPTAVLMNYYQYDGGANRELYVPALRFPVTNPAAANGQWIVIPLVKDILESVVNPVTTLPADDAVTNAPESGSSTAPTGQ